MKEIVKAFKHLARDIMIYILPGFTLLAYVLFIFNYQFNMFEKDEILSSKNLLIILIGSYIIGHIILGFMELFVYSKVDKLFFKKERRVLEEATNNKIDAELEILAYSKRKAYDFFVERHTQLSLFRWNLSGAFLIISILSFLFIINNYNCNLLIIGIFSFIIFLILFIFSIRTELDGLNRRKVLAAKK
ncbi:hypothetical protein ACE01N_04700 [Saccharicrinis sp. FJH2]|uniref:hypothetical protein n=1 Tax=Saccharicrinis sp. FJH65 TaxID=3344659 RepID=UPI0035F3DB11